MNGTIKTLRPKKTVAGIGAIIGDIVGSPYEFDQNNIKTENFPLFSPHSRPTDDTIMTLAVARALAQSLGKDRDDTRAALIASMLDFGHKYPMAGYGARFHSWLAKPVPYNSYGNGSAMRVSAAGWLYGSLAEVLNKAELTAKISHNHPEGIKGAKATAAAIFLTRCGVGKKDLKDYIEKEFGYNLNRTLAEIRPTYHHVESCQQTVPEAITAYLEGNSFEDVLRKAVSLGGDSDTLAAIAASIAEAAYPIPEDIRAEALARLDDTLLAALASYEKAIQEQSAV